MFDLTHEYRNSRIKGAWHLVYYLPKNRPHGSFSDNILRFKETQIPYVRAWSIWAFNEIRLLSVKFDYIIRALGSTELKTNNQRGLDGLGHILAKNLPAVYCPQALQKNRITPSMHTLKTKPERIAAIEGSYFVATKDFNFNNKNILIIDDVTTSRTTLNEILRALREVWPHGNYYFFCLGRTSYDENANAGVTDRFFKLIDIPNDLP